MRQFGIRVWRAHPENIIRFVFAEKEKTETFLLRAYKTPITASVGKIGERKKKDRDNDVLSLLNIHKHEAPSTQMLVYMFYTYDTLQKFNSHLAI